MFNLGICLPACSFLVQGSDASWANEKEPLQLELLCLNHNMMVPAYSLRAVGIDGNTPAELMEKWHPAAAGKGSSRTSAKRGKH